MDKVLSAIAGTLIATGAVVALALVSITLLSAPVGAVTPSVTYEVRTACYEMVTAKEVPNGPPVVLLLDVCNGSFKWVKMPAAPEQGA